MIKIKIIFNDIALEYRKESKHQVVTIFKKFAETYLELDKHGFKSNLFIKEPLKQVRLCDDYYIEQLYNESNLKPDFRRLILGICTKMQIIDVDTKNVFELNEIRSSLCAFIIENNYLAISLDMNDSINGPFLVGDFINNGTSIPNVSIPNLCDKEHINIHSNLLDIRIYEENPKHKIGYGWGSPMDLEENLAQEVLEHAVMYTNGKNCLINKYDGKYYIFRRHINNCYHGYIDDKVPQNVKNKFL